MVQERKGVCVNGEYIWKYTTKDGRSFGYKDPIRVVYKGSIQQGTADFGAYQNGKGMYLVFQDEWGNTHCPMESDVL